MTVAARTSLALNPEAPEQNAARWNERARGRAIGLAVMAIVIFGLADTRLVRARSALSR